MVQVKWYISVPFYPTYLYIVGRVSSKQTKKQKNTVRTVTNRNPQDLFRLCFGCVSICFVKPKTTNFCLFRLVSVFRTYIEITETNRTNSKKTETTLNFLKNTKICSLSNCFHWSSVLFRFNRNIETLYRNNRNKLFQNKPNKPGKPKFSEKIPKYAPYQTVSVSLLFVSVQSKHRNSLFRNRSETTETNILF